jgi:hypothetical protein
MDRYARHQTIAGRDVYDIHHFFLRGFRYLPDVIHERTNLEMHDFFQQLIFFINKHVNQTIINEDLNSLLPNRQFQKIRKVLISETLAFLESELKKTKDN